MLHHEELTGGILGAAFEVHSRLGPGLLESEGWHHASGCLNVDLGGLRATLSSVVLRAHRGE